MDRTVKRHDPVGKYARVNPALELDVPQPTRKHIRSIPKPSQNRSKSNPTPLPDPEELAQQENAQRNLKQWMENKGKYIDPSELRQYFILINQKRLFAQSRADLERVKKLIDDRIKKLLVLDPLTAHKRQYGAKAEAINSRDAYEKEYLRKRDAEYSIKNQETNTCYQCGKMIFS
jgi:hypothetical protein